MGHEAEDIGGLGQGESAELRPHDDDVVGHPADSEDGDDQEDRLSRLKGEITCVNLQDVVVQYISTPLYTPAVIS